MRSIRRVLMVSAFVAFGAACKKDKPPEPKKFDGPMPIQFGACAGPNVSFVSGPKPLPFTQAEAEGDWTAQADEPPPPPPEDKPDDKPPEDDTAGTGGAMALEEGKMGKRDSDRAEGQYKMRNNNVEEGHLARQEAIDTARAAGILGESRELKQGAAFASLTGTGDISSGFDDSNVYGGLLGNEAGEMQGGFGFGRSGFGPGGGGTGWGAIGTGRYGTIGHGSGTGNGYGVGGGRGGMRGRAAAVPTVAIGQPNAQGDLDKAIIRRYIKRNIQKITYCYEKQLLAKPNLSGTVSTQFFIAPTGMVASATASGVDPEVAGCVADVIKGIEFPKPKGGGGVQVNYPFTFRYEGQSSSSPPAAAGSADATGSAGSAAGSADTTPPPTPPTPAAGAGSSAGSAAPPAEPLRDIYRTRDHRADDATSYDPGAKNPLRSVKAELVECLRRNPEHHGVAVVQMIYDKSGAVTGATVNGISDSYTSGCIVDAVKKNVKSAGAPAERCSLSFGEMPVSAAPGIDVTDAAITLAGKTVVPTPNVLADHSPSLKIDSLYEAIGVRLRTLTTVPTPPVVSLFGPLVLRAPDATPMMLVNRILYSVLAAGDDLVFATKDGADWKLWQRVALPIVPVPFGTGGHWTHMKGKSRDMAIAADEDERVMLSLLVTKDKVWIGLSRVSEFTPIERSPKTNEQLLTQLKAQKASAFFADRTDIEIAAEDDVTYREFVDALEAAITAGFTDWQVSDPNGLSARPAL